MQDGLAVEVTYEDFHAYHDHMGKTLQVTGTVHVKGGGFAVELVPGKPRGINDRIVHLELKLIPTGESPSTQAVEYRRPWDPDGIDYTEVEFSAPDAKDGPPEHLKIEDIY